MGRAKNGIRKRVERHLRKQKTCFWHIDHFLRRAEVIDIWKQPDFFDECRLVSQVRQIARGSEIPAQKFGASDCRCPGHLLYLSEVVDMDDLRQRLGLDKLEIRLCVSPGEG